jgi:hypothetical protein
MHHLSKIKIRNKNKSIINFAKKETLVESLYTLRSKDGLPVLEVLKILHSSKADSVSLSMDHPFHYFYARKNGDYFAIILQKEDKEIEFNIPFEIVNRFPL